MAVVAPEIPVLGYIAVGLLAALAWIVFSGLAYGYRATFGWFMERLAELLPAHHWYFPVDIRGAVQGVNAEMYGVLTHSAAKAEHAMGYLFHGAAVLQEWASRELLHLANETLASVEWLTHAHTPKLVKALITAALPPLLIARLVQAAVHAELPHLIRVSKTYVQGATTVITQRIAVPYLSQLQWIHHHWRALQHAISVAGAAAVPIPFPWVHVFPRLRDLEREVNSVRKRFGRVEALLGVTAFAGLMAKVLGLPNWRCLTRGNVGRTARALCGIPTHLLNDLLALVVDFVVITDICQVVGWLSDAFTLVEGPLADLSGTVGAALCHGDYSAPEQLAVRPFTAPPLQARSAPVEV